jgi:hypothetical protein
MENIYPCDELGICPFNAEGGNDCYNYCGLGADESKPENYSEEE